ncbi:MAG: transcriptional repressor [Syntrophales bacterium]|nr:transcriptional repressor [Syntrophales bacterium]MCK9528115.1 transcriptional repressor [Syntrophales bacterium]MDX9921084.1 Fur family transcriptional regulator [Syntrophales bacterium]
MTGQRSPEKLLAEHNIKPSYQRLKVMEYLSSRRNHPTVDEIHRALVQDIPTLSKTTVYNTLTLFARANLVRRVIVDDSEAHYDVLTDCHGHFKCDSCGRIYDFPLGSDLLGEEGLASFEIRERNVYYRGICSTCRD